MRSIMSKKTKRFIRSTIKSIKKFLIVCLCLCMGILPEFYVNSVVGLPGLMFLFIVTGTLISKLYFSVYPMKASKVG